MKHVSVACQAGIFDFKIIAGYVIDLLEKCHEVHLTYKACSNDLQQGREKIEQAELTMGNMQTTIVRFSDTVDSLGVHMLQDNVAAVQRNLQIDRLQREIAVKKERLAKHAMHAGHHEARAKEERLRKMKDERAKLELQLSKLNKEIDVTYETMFEAQEKLYGIKALRDQRREEDQIEILKLSETRNSFQQKKQQLLSVTAADNVVDLHELYVSPAEFRKLQTEIEEMRHKQIQVNRHLQVQLEERDFLKSTADDIVQRVYDLERKVRKETGDHGWTSPLTNEPTWYPDLGAPSIWYLSPTLTVDQLKTLRDQQYRKFGYPRAITSNEAEAETSGIATEEMVCIDMIGSERESEL